MSPTRFSLQLDKYRFAPMEASSSSSNPSRRPVSFKNNSKFAEDDRKPFVMSFTVDGGDVQVQVDRSTTTGDADAHEILYPFEETERRSFRTKQGKAVTGHQWAVYDFVRKIPVGRVTTYKAICSALGSGSPRSVGTALRNNPFAPFVPCHRVIASTGYIGGFLGEWNNPGENVRRKVEILSQEGVAFDEKGYLIADEEAIWIGEAKK